MRFYATYKFARLDNITQAYDEYCTTTSKTAQELRDECRRRATFPKPGRRNANVTHRD